MRIIDALKAHGIEPAPQTTLANDPAEFSRLRCELGKLANEPRFETVVADNVAEYFYAGTDQEYWGPEDVACAAPPFDSFMIEWRRPSSIVSKECGVTQGAGLPLLTGILFQTVPVDVWQNMPGGSMPDNIRSAAQKNLEAFAASPDGQRIFQALRSGASLSASDRSLLEQVRALFDVADTGGVQVMSHAKAWAEKEKVRWQLLASIFIRPSRETPTIGPIMAWSIAIREDGTLPGRPQPLVYSDDVRLGQALSETLTGSLYAALLALSFLHCKNVELCEGNPSRKAILNVHRAFGRAVTRYKILKIGPLEEIIRQRTDDQPTGVKRALHICRGHFKDYRKADSKPLFGKYRGIWFWGPQTRGTSNVGTVVKDYDLRRP